MPLPRTPVPSAPQPGYLPRPHAAQSQPCLLTQWQCDPLGAEGRSLTGDQYSLGKSPPTVPWDLSVHVSPGDIPLFSRPSIYLTAHFALEEVRFQSNVEPGPAGWTSVCGLRVPTRPSQRRGPGSQGQLYHLPSSRPGWWSVARNHPGVHCGRCQISVTSFVTLSPSHTDCFLHHDRLKIKFKSIPSFFHWCKGVMYRPVALNTSFFLIHIKMKVTI